MPSNTRSLRAFAAQHDALPAFQAGYIVLTFIVAALFRLGTFALLIAAHMALDVMKYREYRGLAWGKTIRAVVRENITDVALFTIGLACAVYFHYSLPVIAGVSGISRAFLSILGAAGTTVPKWEIGNRFVRTLRNMPAYLQDKSMKIGAPFDGMERFCFFAIVFNLALIAISPFLLATDTATIIGVVLEEMRLW